MSQAGPNWNSERVSGYQDPAEDACAYKRIGVKFAILLRTCSRPCSFVRPFNLFVLHTRWSSHFSCVYSFPSLCSITPSIPQLHPCSTSAVDRYSSTNSRMKIPASPLLLGLALSSSTLAYPTPKDRSPNPNRGSNPESSPLLSTPNTPVVGSDSASVDDAWGDLPPRISRRWGESPIAFLTLYRFLYSCITLGRPYKVQQLMLGPQV